MAATIEFKLIYAWIDFAQVLLSQCFVNYVCYVSHVIFSWTTTPKQQKAGIENPIINVYDMIFGEGAYFTPPYPPSMMTFSDV